MCSFPIVTGTKVYTVPVLALLPIVTGTKVYTVPVLAAHVLLPYSHWDQGLHCTSVGAPSYSHWDQLSVAGCTQCREPSYTVSILIHMDNIDNDNKNYKMFAFSLTFGNCGFDCPYHVQRDVVGIVQP